MPIQAPAAWERLSPRVRRWLVLGSVLGGVALIVVLAFGQPPDTPAARAQQAREHMTSTLLTDVDPRALGIDGLAQRLTRLERQLADTSSNLARLKTAEAGSVNRQVQERQQGQTAQLASLRQEIDRLKTQREALPPAPPPPIPAAIPVPAVPKRPETVPDTPPAINDPALFATQPTPVGASLNPSATAPRATRAPPAIRVVGQETATKPMPTPAGTAAASGAAPQVIIPAGSILRGVLLSGMDAPTGKQARRDPYPALLRVKHDAILPNRFRADVRECFITVAGYGELSSERAFLRTEVMTCVRHDGGVIEVPVDGYAVGEDGKVGLRGRLVSKQGQIIARAMQVSFLEGLSEVFGKQPVSVISTTPSNQVAYQDVLSEDSAQAAALSGTGKALDRLAQYYLDMAQDIFPVIEIDAGRAIEVILNRGTALQLIETGRTRGQRR
ncbi:TrbI/VirB10 family protein [Thiocystis violacea]|uniref:TrbI/VirB10 family protein n=1 Tax=Thiocystis violacea TaxID=13725 RepID=UPI001906342D|nr:TrbI/VirB10 family protein [Thiocystis violacea]MBK1717299.1 conjugal transfer protein TraB [Thiocystis violacea]